MQADILALERETEGLLAETVRKSSEFYLWGIVLWSLSSYRTISGG